MIGMNTGLEGTRRKYDTAIFEKAELKNGVTVWAQTPQILTDMGGELIVLLKNVGSQLDPKDSPGTAHFFEHIPFRGTKDRPSPELLSQDIEERGGEIGAETGKLVTKFWVSDLSGEDLRLGVETLFQMVMNPLLREGDVEAERSVIEQEYNDGLGDQEKVVLTSLRRILYSGHPWAKPTIGTLEMIRSMTATQLREFHTQYYHAGNIHIIVGGAFAERANYLEIIEERFGELPHKSPTVFPPFKLPLSQTGIIKIKNDQCVNDYIVMVYPFDVSWDRYLLEFFAQFLGGPVSSPLVSELRVKRGLIYHNGLTSTESYPGSRYFTTILQTPVTNFEEVWEVFQHALKSLSTERIQTSQRQRQRRRNTLFARPSIVCHEIDSEIINDGRPSSCWEDEAREDEVTIEEVLRLRDYLVDTEPLTCFIKA